MPSVGSRVIWKGEMWLVRSVERVEHWVTLMKDWQELDKPDEGPRIPLEAIKLCDSD